MIDEILYYVQQHEYEVKFVVTEIGIGIMTVINS